MAATERQNRFREATNALHWCQMEVGQALAQAFQSRVQDGPFAGLNMAPVVPPEAPQLLGCYEEELFPWIERMIAQAPTLVVNVGARQGYYAAGMGMRLPQARIIAYEADPVPWHGILAAMADCNDLSERFTIGGTCTPDILAATLTKPAHIIMDCEGEEIILLDPEHIPMLRHCTILVELHDIWRPGCTEAVTRRFAESHRIERSVSQGRNIARLPALQDLGSLLQLAAVCEFRPCPMDWLLLTPLSAAA
ncbi:MAG: hypothetical protein K2Q10_00480 [Rhodospirillales bacterium]|nr:hypothetical protein [Rhodospirillales bacterium]